MYGELKRTGMEMVMAYSNKLSWHWLEGSDGNNVSEIMLKWCKSRQRI